MYSSSSYGLFVWTNVRSVGTLHQLSDVGQWRRSSAQREGTNIRGAFCKSLLIPVEALEAALVMAIHGRVLLVAEGEGLREYAFSMSCTPAVSGGRGVGGVA